MKKIEHHYWNEHDHEDILTSKKIKSVLKRKNYSKKISHLKKGYVRWAGKGGE